MNSAESVQSWFEAVEMYDQGIIEEAIEKFREVNRSAKILFNIACCYLKMEDIDNAVRKYSEAIELDPHLAIAYFMLGLTNFLDEEYSEAMCYFEQSLEKLRGNRFVDYRQLGFKYQLYSCEILTNQAVCAYKQKKLGKAKGLLLQAVGCKAEKKHESIVESLSMIQSGYPISPFIPPQSEIFRPPKALVANLKKKNYLGKAQVISTENTEEIYACFSGIRDQVNDTSTPRKPLLREKMIEDIKVPDRKATLRRIPPRPPKERPADVTGRVIESSSSERKRPPERGLPSLPGRESPTPPQRALPKSPSLNQRRTPPSPPRSPSPPERLQTRTTPRTKKPPILTGRGTIPPPSTPSSSKPPFRPPPRASSLIDQNNNEESEEETYEEIDDSSIRYKPGRPPPILPKRNDDEPPARTRLPSNPVPNRRPGRISQQETPPEKPPHVQNRKESNVSKPGRIPPPPPPDSSELNGEVTPPPRKYHPSPTSSLNNSSSDADFKNEMNNVLRKISKANDAETGRKKSGSTTSITSPIRKDSRPQYEVEVQYTFVHKITVSDGLSMKDLEQLVKKEGVPDDIELCFTDDLGRQQTLTEKKMKRVFDQNYSSPKKLFCFPDD